MPRDMFDDLTERADLRVAGRTSEMPQDEADAVLAALDEIIRSDD